MSNSQFEFDSDGISLNDQKDVGHAVNGHVHDWQYDDALDRIRSS